jgi:phage-related protein (TIGR01555 family)
MTKRKPQALHLHRNDSAVTRSRKQMNVDGWTNIYTGMGVSGKDKLLGTSFKKVPLFTEQQLTDLYRGDGFAKRIINFPTGEMTRAWFEVNGDTDGVINKFQEKLRVKQNILLALRWAHLYGGSIIVMLINDGRRFEEPVDESNIQSIETFRVYHRYRVTWTTTDLYDDPENPKFGQLQWYNVSPVSAGGLLQPFRVHETRILRFEGEPVDNKSRYENNGWGDSTIQSVYNELKNLTGSFFASRNVLEDFIQTIIKIDNLAELVAAGQDALVRKRLEILDLGRHLINTMMLDSKEDYAKHSSSVAGIDKLLGKQEEALSAVTEIPLTLLMGQTPKGFNSKDEGSVRKWYDKVAEDQDDELKPQLERLVYLTMLSKKGPTGGQVIEEWSITFNRLWQPTEAETVEMRKKQAETDHIYIQDQVLMPEEVGTSRFGGEEYSIETTIDIDNRSKPAGKEDPEDKDTMDAWEKIKSKGNTSWDANHFHPYTVDDDGNGKAESGTIPFYKGSKESFTLTHDHEIIAFRVQSGGTDGHDHDLEYDLSE